MYHDEFAKRPAGAIVRQEEARPGLAVELGGGLSLGLAIGLDPSISLLIFQVGGLLPLVVSSLAMAARSAADRLDRVRPGPSAVPPIAVPAHPMHALAGPMARARIRHRRPVAAR